MKYVPDGSCIPPLRCVASVRPTPLHPMYLAQKRGRRHYYKHCFDCILHHQEYVFVCCHAKPAHVRLPHTAPCRMYTTQRHLYTATCHRYTTVHTKCSYSHNAPPPSPPERSRTLLFSLSLLFSCTLLFSHTRLFIDGRVCVAANNAGADNALCQQEQHNLVTAGVEKYCAAVPELEVPFAYGKPLLPKRGA